MAYIEAEQLEIPGTPPAGPAKEYKRASVLNKTEVKRRMLQYAKDKRSHRFTRVSADTLINLEARVESMIRALVDSAPSRGKTL